MAICNHRQGLCESEDYKPNGSASLVRRLVQFSLFTEQIRFFFNQLNLFLCIWERLHISSLPSLIQGLPYGTSFTFSWYYLRLFARIDSLLSNLLDSPKLETADIKAICYYGNIYLSNIIQSFNFVIPPNSLFHQIHIGGSLLSKAIRVNIGRVPENNRS